MGLLDSPLIKKIRRNHGLEHATVHVLHRRLGRISVVGHSDWNGFTLYGPIDTSEIKLAAHEALRRLRQGETELAREYNSEGLVPSHMTIKLFPQHSMR